MIYLLDTELKTKKKLYIALSHIYGIGISRSKKLLKKLGLSLTFQTRYLSTLQTKKIIKLVNYFKFIVNDDLKKQKNLNVLKLLNTKSLRGLRLVKGLPVRGQRTHTNSKTSRKVKHLF